MCGKYSHTYFATLYEQFVSVIHAPLFYCTVILTIRSSIAYIKSLSNRNTVTSSEKSLEFSMCKTSSTPATLYSFFVPPPIVTYRLLSHCLLSRGATAGKGSLREALSNNVQPVDLYSVTLSFHTLSKAAIMAWEGLRPGGKLQAGQGMPSIKIAFIILNFPQIVSKNKASFHLNGWRELFWAV